MAKLPSSMRDPLPKAVFHTHTKTSFGRMLHENRRVRFAELYGWWDPEDMAPHQEPPIGVRAAAEEVYGDWLRWEKAARDAGRDTRRPPDPTRIGWLKLGLHPWFHRWCIFQWCPDHGEKGPDPSAPQMCWKPTHIFWGEARDGYLPSDLDDPDGRFDELRGRVGDYYVPTKQDFAEFARVSNRSLYEKNWTQTEAAFEDQTREEREAADQIVQFEWDFADYYSALGCRDTNRMFGSMQGLPFLPGTSLEQLDKERESALYITEEKVTPSGEVYKVRQRVENYNANYEGPPTPNDAVNHELLYLMRFYWRTGSLDDLQMARWNELVAVKSAREMELPELTGESAPDVLKTLEDIWGLSPAREKVLV